MAAAQAPARWAAGDQVMAVATALTVAVKVASADVQAVALKGAVAMASADV